MDYMDNDYPDVDIVDPDPDYDPDPDEPIEPVEPEKPKREAKTYSMPKANQLIAKVLANKCGMRYCRAAVGSGYIPDELSPYDMTEPAGYVMDADIASVTNPVAGECQVEVQVCSDNVDTAFYVTGIMLYAEDPDEGEIPYTYMVLEDLPQVIRARESALGYIATFNLIAVVNEVEQVSANISPHALVTRELVTQLIRQNTLVRNVVIPDDGWNAGAKEVPDGTLYQDIPVQDASEAMTPMVSILPAFANIARECGIHATVRSVPGAIRVYSDKKPSSAMEASVVLLRTYDGTIGDETPEQRGTLTYNGQVQEAAWANFDDKRFYISGTYKAMDAGEYTAEFNPKVGCAWADGSTWARPATWRIEPATTQLPVQEQPLVYTGGMQHPEEFTDYELSKYDADGELNAINAGEYFVRLTPTPNYRWQDGSRLEKTVSWRIDKAPGSLEVDEQTVAISVGQNEDVLATRLGDGVVSATSDDTSIASVRVTDDIVSITGRGAGTTDVTVNCTEGTNYLEPAGIILSVTVTDA